MNDRIEKRIELTASADRLWRALTDYRGFGQWFRVELDGPFELGRVSRGHVTYPGFEHLKWEATVQAMEPQRLFSLTWHPHPMDPNRDYSQEAPTLVEFRLENSGGGTLLTISESGFEKLPAGRRDEAFRANDRGWAMQMDNIRTYLEQNP